MPIRRVLFALVITFVFVTFHTAKAIDLSNTSGAFNANINISGKIIKDTQCALSVAKPLVEYTVAQNKVPNYQFYTDSGVNVGISAWYRDTTMPGYVSAERDFVFTLRCNAPAISYKLLIDPSTIKFPEDPTGQFSGLFLPQNATTEVGTKVGFMIVEETSTERISSVNVKNRVPLPIPGFSGVQCSVLNAPIGQLGHCTKNFRMVATLVAADTTGDTAWAQYAPYYWIREQSYYLNLVLSVEFN